ncbi:putative vacuolar protein sorting-associated protein Ist1 [Helianthus annuus]|nr:putative vacuolar protein sorting-associated protein Ist1 [Helianthus annuus]
MKLLAFIANVIRKLFTNMSEALLKRKIYKKRTLLIKGTLMRIAMIKRRRSVMRKHYRSDIAELMRIGHNSDAFAGVGRLYVYENMLLSYEFVERYCTLVLNQLKAMNDECPSECKEAVSSLMYAAARFGDVPELGEVRSLFFDMFGNSFESFVNKEFIDLLNPNSPTKEMKIQLMQEIAQEHGVEWSETVGDDQDGELCLTDHKYEWVVNIPETITDDSNACENDESDHDVIAEQNQGNEPRINDHKNGWMVNIQETINDDNNDREKDKSDDDDIVKQVEIMRQRISDYISGTTSQLSTSRETNASPEECSAYSDNSTKSRFSEHDDEKENEDVQNDSSYVVKWDDENVVAAPCVKSKRWRMTGASPQVKIYPVECWPAVEEVQKLNKSAAKYQQNLTFDTMASVNSFQPCGESLNPIAKRLTGSFDIVV